MDMLDHALDGTDPKEMDDEVHLTEADLQDGKWQYAEVNENEADGDDGTINVGGALTIDPTVQYQLRTDPGQAPVTYRVVQVAQSEDGTHQIVAGIPSGMTQTVVQSPFSNGESPDALGNEARFTYVPTVTGGDLTGAEGITPAALGQVATTGEPGEGQFYVMMSPQDVLQAGQRTIAPRTTISPRMEGGRSTRDERRRATHNEVERRRRDKINNWIVQLSKLVPDCAAELNKQGQVHVSSKGGILSKACDYIQDLRGANSRMAESLKETERLTVDAELLRQQCEELKQENAVLRATLQQHGIVITDLAGNTT